MNTDEQTSDTNQLGQHIEHLQVSHVWCHQSSGNVPSTFLLSILATEDCHAESIGTCDQELPNHLADFALIQYKYTAVISAS